MLHTNFNYDINGCLGTNLDEILIGNNRCGCVLTPLDSLGMSSSLESMTNINSRLEWIIPELSPVKRVNNTRKVVPKSQCINLVKRRQLNYEKWKSKGWNDHERERPHILRTLMVRTSNGGALTPMTFNLTSDQQVPKQKLIPIPK